MKRLKELHELSRGGLRHRLQKEKNELKLLEDQRRQMEAQSDNVGNKAFREVGVSIDSVHDRIDQILLHLNPKKKTKFPDNL